MKIDIAICIVVVSMTAFYPLFLQHAVGEIWLAQAEDLRSTASLFEEAAADIEDGRKEAYAENIPHSFRMQANADESHAKAYESLHNGFKHIRNAMLFTVVAQAGLLGVLLYRRWA